MKRTHLSRIRRGHKRVNSNLLPSSSKARCRFGSAASEAKLLESSIRSRLAGARDYLDTRGNGTADSAVADERNALFSIQ